MKKNIFPSSKGFSLIELIITISIAGVLSLLLPQIFLNTQQSFTKNIKHANNNIESSVFKKYISKDLRTVGMFSVAMLNLKATSPTSGNTNFFDYYENYPIHLLNKEQQSRSLKFTNQDAQEGYIYFLQEYQGGVNGHFSIDPFSLYDYDFDQQFNNKDEATFKPDTNLRSQITESMRSDIWSTNNFILFYVALYFSKSTSIAIDLTKPSKRYSYLSVVNTLLTFPTFGGLLNLQSVLPGSSTNINSLKKVIENTPFVGGNVFQLYMTRIQFLTYFFQRGPKGGSLYRCVNPTYVSNLKTYCNQNTGNLILTNIKEIEFFRKVNSTSISVNFKLLK